MKAAYIITAGLILTFILAWLAWRRPDRRHLAARVIATAVAVASLVLLACPPVRQVRLYPATAILLTPGFSADSLRAWQQKMGRSPLVLSYQDAAPAYPVLASTAQLPQRYPLVRRLHVLGYGLPAAELQALGAIRLILHLPAPPTGIVAADWQPRLQLGQVLQVTGQYHQPAPGSTWLYLLAGGQAVDSVRLQQAGRQRFTLRYRPRQAGRQVYGLQSRRGRGRQPAGLVAVEVSPPAKYRVLLLPASPGFEFRFLRNYLAEQQHGVAWRVPVSKDIYQTDYVNLARRDLRRLSPDLLRHFDVVVTEQEVLNALPGGEKRALEQAVEQQGTGLLVLPGKEPDATIPLIRDFTFVRRPGSAPAAVAVVWPDQNRPLPATALPYLIRLQEGQRALAWSPQGVLVATRPRGWGRVAVSLLPQTFTWQLAGQQNKYAGYWSAVLGQLVPARRPGGIWHLPQPLAAAVHQPVVLQLWDDSLAGAARLAPAALQTPAGANLALPLEQGTLLPHRFSTTFWPRQVGWHQVRQAGGTPHHFYIYPDSAWQAAGQNARLRQTRAFARQQGPPGRGAPAQSRQEPIAAGWFFGLFLLSAGFLWLEEKL